MIACALLNSFASASQRTREHRNALAREKAYTVPLDVNASRDVDLAKIDQRTGIQILVRHVYKKPYRQIEMQ